MPYISPTLGLELPTFAEIKAEKALRFPQTSGGNAPYLIYPNLNAMSEAILQALSPKSQPSDDPHLSSLVMAGVTWLSLTLGEPDIQVKKEYLRKSAGKKKEDNVVERHPLYELMARPNPHTIGSDLWKAFAYSWIIRGNVYFLKLRNDFGQVVELWYEPHFSIKARWVNDKQGEYIPADRSQSVASVPRDDSPRKFINYYELLRDGEEFRVEPDDVIHFKDGIDPTNTRYGRSNLTTILREIYGDSAMASYAGELLAGNGVIPYVLAIDDKEGLISPDDLLNIKAKMLEQTTGVNAGKPLVITSRASVQKTGLTPKELDLRSSRYMAQETFSAVTGIPAIVLNFGSGMERSIWNNMSEADRRAVDQYLTPLWWHVAQTLTYGLLRDIDQDETHFVEFDLSEVGALQEDENARWERIRGAYIDGLIKRGEARQAIDYEAAPDGADDVYYVKSGGSTVTLEEEKEQRERPEPPALQPIGPQRLLEAQSKSLAQGLPEREEIEEMRESWKRKAPRRARGLMR